MAHFMLADIGDRLYKQSKSVTLKVLKKVQMGFPLGGEGVYALFIWDVLLETLQG